MITTAASCYRPRSCSQGMRPVRVCRTRSQESMSLRVAHVGGQPSREHAPASVWVVALLGVLLLGFPVPDSTALPRGAAHAGEATVPICHGQARRLRLGQLGFSFDCGETEDVTAFVVRANRTIHLVDDPSFAFGCDRSTSRSFDCEDIHSGAGPEGSGVASVSEPLCHPHAHLVLQITPTLNFEAHSLPTFTLKGPC